MATAVRDHRAQDARLHIAQASAQDHDEILAVLATSARDGNELAVELLVESLDASGVVRKFAGTMLIDETAVDDVAQDALITIARSVAGYRGDSAVTTWVHTIVRSRVVDHLRRERATAPLPADDLGAAQWMSSMIATRATVREALAGLPQLYREPVVLRDIQGLEYAEIAQRLERGLGTVKSQISRGRAMLAARITGEQP